MYNVQVKDPQEILTLFRWDLLRNLTFKTFRGGTVEKNTLYKTTGVNV